MLIRPPNMVALLNKSFLKSEEQFCNLNNKSYYFSEE